MKKFKMVSAAMAGTALEFYDITLYGFFSSLFAPLFFPSADPITSLMASLGAFAAGFLMRPLGGIFFGYVGDKYGRKKALISAIILITLPTVVIGLTPVYANIGIFAPLLVILCRLVQGFSVGGEYGSAAVFISEQVGKERKSLAGSLLCASAFLGAIIGSGLGALCTASFMPSWGWRIPFIVGGIFGLIFYWLRRNTQETASFSLLKQQHNLPNSPLKHILNTGAFNLLCAGAIGANVQVPFYVASLYMQILLTTKLGFSASFALLVNTAVLGLWMILLPFVGLLSDRWGSIKLMSYSALAVMVSVYPLFFLLEHYLSLSTVLFVQLVISLAGVGFMGAAPALMPQLFPVRERVSGTAVGFSLGQALFSGITPLAATALVSWTGDPKAPACYLIFTSLVGFFAVKGAQFILRGETIAHPLHPTKNSLSDVAA